MSDRDDYLKVQGKARFIRDGAVLFSIGESVSRAAWIPRSLVHGADDLTLKSMAGQVNRTSIDVGTPMALRIRRWKAEQIGFAGGPDQDTTDLFDGGPQ